MKSKSRPHIVTWLACGVLIFSILFIIRLFLSYRMPDLPIQVPLWYMSLTGLIWGLGGLILSYALFRTFSWALHLLRWGSLCFVVWYWADRLQFVHSEYGRITWPASIFLSLIALGVIYWCQRKPDVQAAFQEKNK
ncbi:MAG: hypothetical protein A2Z14_12155 [Chloroflexi bacterium RBG_16_48_8]|nr:MAG: hypothetical protein A2Z14_12155 [Chloroflexi bacterium RBG_16_48_8]